jgi:hypothetical protein
MIALMLMMMADVSIEKEFKFLRIHLTIKGLRDVIHSRSGDDSYLGYIICLHRQQHEAHSANVCTSLMMVSFFFFIDNCREVMK